MPTAKAGGNMVASLKIGNTQICICDDDCCDRTADEIEKILMQIARIALPYARADSIAQMGGLKTDPK